MKSSYETSRHSLPKMKLSGWSQCNVEGLQAVKNFPSFNSSLNKLSFQSLSISPQLSTLYPTPPSFKVRAMPRIRYFRIAFPGQFLVLSFFFFLRVCNIWNIWIKFPSWRNNFFHFSSFLGQVQDKGYRKLQRFDRQSKLVLSFTITKKM